MPANCPICGEGYDRQETVDTVEITASEPVAEAKVCVGGYKFRNDTAGVRMYWHDEG